MGRAWSPLSSLKTIAIFLFFAVFYLTIFANQQKSYAGTFPNGAICQSSGQCCSNFCAGIPGYGYGACTRFPPLMCIGCSDPCDNVPQPPPPPPPSGPTCSSFGGVCMHRLGCAPDYNTISAGDDYCSRYGNFSCCEPKNACERAGGTCVGVSSQSVAPCPAGQTYNTSISCENNYLICCTPPGSYVPPPPPPTYTISGQVFNDTNRNGVKDSGEQPVPNVTITVSGNTPHTNTTDGNGNYSYSRYYAGNYTVNISIPSGYVIVPNTSSQYSVKLGPSATGRNFAIVNIYSISGNVFNDLNKDRQKNLIDPDTNPVMEPNITSGITISYSPAAGTAQSGTLNTNSAAGSYTITGLYEGRYNVSYTSYQSLVASGYKIIYPLAGTPPQFAIYVGPNCALNANLSYGATCSNGNIVNVNFAMSNSIPWFQTYGLNMRQDDGFEDTIPSSPDYPAYASVADTATGLTTPTPTLTPTVTPTPTVTLTPTPTTPPPPPNWGGCNAVDQWGRSHPGVCYDRNYTPCPTYYDGGNFCPGGNSVQCCVNSQVACASPYTSGTCHNRYSNYGGNVYGCPGTWYSGGYCPGPFDVQCCR